MRTPRVRGGLKLNRTLVSFRHRLAEPRQPQRKMSLAFLIWRGWNFSWKWKGHFSLGFCLPSIQAGGGTMRTKFCQNFFLWKGFAKTSTDSFLNSDVANGKFPNFVCIVPPPTWILGGQNSKEKCPFHFQEKIHPRQIKKARDFFFGVAEALRGSGGTIRAYDSVSSHHALRASDIICFENRFELGTMNTQTATGRNTFVFRPVVCALTKNRKMQAENPAGQCVGVASTWIFMSAAK